MAQGYENFDNGSDWFDENHPDNSGITPGSQAEATGGSAAAGSAGGGGASPSDAEQQVRDYAASRGVTYDQSDLADVAHRDYTPEAMAMEQRKIDARATNTPNQDEHAPGARTSLAGFGGPTPYQPFTKQFQGPEMPSDLMNKWDRTFQAPAAPTDLMDKWDQTFKWDPTRAAEDPAYQLRMKEMQQAVQRSAAAGGTLMTPGVMQALQDRAAGISSSFMDADFNRALSKYNTDYSTFTGDRTRRGGQYQNDFGNALTGYQTDYNTDQGDKTRRSSLYDTLFNNARNTYLDAAGIHNTNETGRYNSERSNRMDSNTILNDDRNYGLARDNQLAGNSLASGYFGLARDAQGYNQARTTNRDQVGDLQWLGDRGYGAGVSLGNWANNYGNAGAEDITGAGNAQAAGTVGSSNAWQNGINGAANTIGLAASLRSGGTPRRVPISSYGYTPYTG